MSKWITVPTEKIIHLAGVPGIKWGKKTSRVHLTHLPLYAESRDKLFAVPSDSIGKPHQYYGMQFIRGRRGTLLCDEPRTGKTLTAVISTETDRYVLIVCPKFVIPVWVQWIKYAYPEAPITIATKRQAQAFTGKYTIISYDLLASWQRQFEFDTVVIDEIHLLYTSKGKKNQAVRYMAAQAKRIVGLTGTPIWSDMAGLWNLLNIVNPGAWGTKFEFLKRYSNKIENEFGTTYEGVRNTEELTARLSEVILARTLKDVYGEALTPRRILLRFALDKYDVMAVDLAMVGYTGLARANALRSALKDRRKVETINFLKQRDKQVVVWTWHKDLAKEIAEESGGFLITGETSSSKREKILAEWRETNKPLCITLACGQVGIDLSHADLNLFVELDYTPSVMSQAELRIWKPDRPSYSTFLVSDLMVEYRLIEILLEKMKTGNQLNLAASVMNFDEVFK